MSKVVLVPLKESVPSTLTKNVCGPADPGSIVQLSTSTETWTAPAPPPPPRVWKHPEPSTSPQVAVPSAERSNSAQAQKPPRLAPQKSALLQLNEMPTCHMSWSAPPPYAPAVAVVPTIRAAETASDAMTNRIRRIELSFLLCAHWLEGPRALDGCGFAASRSRPELRSLGSARRPRSRGRYSWIVCGTSRMPRGRPIGVFRLIGQGHGRDRRRMPSPRSTHGAVSLGRQRLDDRQGRGSVNRIQPRPMTWVAAFLIRFIHRLAAGAPGLGGRNP